MSDVVLEFAQILESERLCALRADVDALGALQTQKRALLEQLLESEIPEAETMSLREKAHANVQLIRHLVALLHGLIAPDATIYTAGGRSSMSPVGRSWGRL